MSATIVNATPMTYFLGIQDDSREQIPFERPPLPQHLPKIFVYAQKGTTEPQLAVGGSRQFIYGDDTFDERSKYANHATVLANQINGTGNSCMYQRLRPTDAGPDANLALSLEIVADDVPQYQRNTNGTFVTDGLGAPVPVVGGATAAGYKLQWLLTSITDPLQMSSQFGGLVTSTGTLTGTVGGVPTTSTIYPILQLKASSFGEWGNRAGLRLWAPTKSSAIAVNADFLSRGKAYPFHISFIYKNILTGNGQVVESNAGSAYTQVCFKPDAMDKRTDTQMYIGDVVPAAWQLLENPLGPPKVGQFGASHVYQDNVDAVLALLYAAEAAVNGSALWSDVSSADIETKYNVNFVSGKHSTDAPYSTITMVSTASSAVALANQSTTPLDLYARGGSDGTMNDVEFTRLVMVEMDNYANPDHPWQDMAKYPESIFYDSGFHYSVVDPLNVGQTLEGKKALAKFISQRKDTAVVLSTHTVGEPALDAAARSGLAKSLGIFLKFYPESDYYGTSTCRGMVVGGAGTNIRTTYRKKLPLSIDMGVKSAKFMGAGNGKWTSRARFDANPGNMITDFKDLDVTFVPASMRVNDWENGLVWAQSFDMRQYFFPATQTVYPDDTSVLNSWITVLACCYLEKVGDLAWRVHTGTTGVTNEVFAARVERFIAEQVTGIFDDMFVITPRVYYTDSDLARGYSWHTEIKIESPMMKTVQVLNLTARRLNTTTGG